MDTFVELRDPRCHQCRYPLDEIVLTALCAVRYGVEDWETMALWGRTQRWLRKPLAYANGIPYEDSSGGGVQRIEPGCLRSPLHRMGWGCLCPSFAGLHVTTQL
ncbi:MAG: transposase family protein [Burkholderia sp.]